MRPAPPAAPPDFPAPPQHGFRGDAPPPAPLTRPKGLTVAVSRESGSRGGAIARAAAELLGWQVFTQDQLDYLLQDETAIGQLLADVPAGAREWADDQLARLRSSGRLKADDAAVETARLLLTVAARGEAVVVGRGAGFLLPTETTLHVRVVAPAEERVRYYGQRHLLSPEQAAGEVAARDGRRAKFLADTFLRDPADPTGYDLVLNSGRLGVDSAARLVAEAVRLRQLRPDDAERYPDVSGAAGDDAAIGAV